MEPVVVPITDTLDLHHFNPGDIKDLLMEYIHACREKNIVSIKIIHGKGKGILKDRVHRILKSHPHVRDFSDGSMGNWGATCVELSRLP
ncbi:MAG: Smr/MutS family protein [Proteobacteria bacterium]|nr:Smr/MutS family protein [Pseudomonadota bacterium]